MYAKINNLRNRELWQIKTGLLRISRVGFWSWLCHILPCSVNLGKSVDFFEAILSTREEKIIPSSEGMLKNFMHNEKKQWSPDWCGSVDWALACKPKGHRFESQSGHKPGLRARSPAGGTQEATTHPCISPFLSPSLPLSIQMNKRNTFLKAVKMWKVIISISPFLTGAGFPLKYNSLAHAETWALIMFFPSLSDQGSYFKNMCTHTEIWYSWQEIVLLLIWMNLKK